MGLGLVGTMTGPLLVVLHTMPSAVFAGVFFVVGVSSVSFFIFLLHSPKTYLTIIAVGFD